MPTIKAKIDGNWVTMGGVGPGVKPGGTQNQILSKASAADYDTAWTSAPVLTDLSIVDTTTPTLILQRTGGSPPVAWYTQIHSGGYLIFGHTSDENQSNMALDPTTRNVLFNGSVSINSDLTLFGTLNSKHAVRAMTLVNAGTGETSLGFGFASGTRTGTGVYRLTLATTLSNPLTWVSPANNPYTMYTVSVSATQFDVHSVNAAGTHVDTWFYALVMSL